MPTGEREARRPARPCPGLPSYFRSAEGGREKEGDDEISGERGPFAQIPPPFARH